MENIDAIRINFDASQLTILNLCLAFIMFGIALDLTSRDFKRLLDKPRPALIGLSSQLILLPILTFGLVNVWPMPVSVAMGLIMVASCPGGNISNFAVHLSRGNTALSITMTSIVTMTAIIITPFTFLLWTSLLPGASELMTDIEVKPLSMFKAIGQLILIPLVAGMYIRHKYPETATRIKRIVGPISLVMFAGFIVVALYENRANLDLYLRLVFLVVLVHNGLALLMGYFYARAWRLPFRDAKAISMETGIQNSGLGLILIFNFFDGLGGMMLVAAWWGVWDMISSLTLAMYWRYRQAHKISEKPLA